MTRQRQITPRQKIKAVLVAAAVWCATAVAARLCPVRAVRGVAWLDDFVARKQPFILCLWHDRLAYLPWFVARRLRRTGLETHVLISRSRDGEIMARLAGRLGYRVVRGSTSRGGVSGLRELARRLRRGGLVGTVGDGPRGPRHVCKPGPVALAKLTGAPIIPVAYAAEKAWVLDSWDRFILPKPLSGVAVVYGEPVTVPRGAGDEDVAARLAELERGMQATLAEAESLLRR